MTTSLTSSTNPSTYGQTTTLTATVTANANGEPTVYTVNSIGSGTSGTGIAGTLPYVIGLANMNPNLAGSVIQFAPSVFNTSNPQTIILASTLIWLLHQDRWYRWPRRRRREISGGGTVGVFLGGPAR